MTSRRSREIVKRRRESYQLFLQPHAELPPHRCSRTESNGLPPQPYDASHASLLSEGRGEAVSAFERCSTSANAISTGAPSSFHRCTRASPTSETAASLPVRDLNTLRLRLRPVRVDIVRGDTGRRTSFLLATTIRYAWHHGNRVYRSLAGEEAGVELRETVVCEVVSAPSSPSSWSACPSAAAWHQQALLCNEEVAVASPTNAAAAMTREASLTPSPPFLSAAPCACYSYEATQVSRRLAPPTSPGWQAVDVAADLGSSTPALFVECLLKCVHDEVALSDDCGWVYLYHGRHIVSEIGRTRILQDIFAHAYDGDHSNGDATAEGGVPLATLTICVFRKH